VFSWIAVAIVLLAIAAWLTVPALRVDTHDGPGVFAVAANPSHVSVNQGTFVFREASPT
jgi:hypothetical protein